MRKEHSVEIADLLDKHGETLRLQLISDWGGLSRQVTKPRIQKPGLALSGFVKHIYDDRVQIFGLSEIDYLISTPAEQIEPGLRAYFAKDIPVIVTSRGLDAPPVLREGAREHGVPILRSALPTSALISGITRVLEDWLAPKSSIHGVLVDVLGVGCLLIGRSGVGKSEAALDLVMKGHRLVADDVVEASLRPPATIWGAATQLHQHHMEIRGMGILNITHLFGVAAVRDTKKIEVVVELSEADEEDYDRLGTEQAVWPVLGVDIPLVRIPLRPGRNIASLIEVVARNQLLKFRGHDSAREFQEKVAAHIAQQTEAATGVHGRSERSGALIPISEME